MPIPQNLSNPNIPKTAKERIYLTLRDWIIEGTLKPEEKLSDLEISQYFSVSRTPVREAMQLLADQKLIEIFPGRESRVAPINLDTMQQNYRMIAEIHALALEFAFPYITSEIISNLEKINKKFSQASQKKEFRNANIYDTEFHNIFFELAGNDFLKNFAEILGNHVTRIEILYYRIIKDFSTSIDDHNAIISALKNNNLELAKESMKSNWLHTLDIIENINDKE